MNALIGDNFALKHGLDEMDARIDPRKSQLDSAFVKEAVWCDPAKDRSANPSRGLFVTG